MSAYMGIYGGRGPNPAAALIKNGRLIAFVEEERFSRVKMAPSALPINSMLYCLEAGGIGFEQLSAIGFGWDCPGYVSALDGFFAQQQQKYPFPDSEYYSLQKRQLALGFDPVKLEHDLALNLFKRGYDFPKEKLTYFPHHLCHASSAFFASGFDDALVFVADGSGENVTTSLWEARGQQLDSIKSFSLPHSLGGVYSTFTEFLGFRADVDEGKLMGLAPFGAYSEEIQNKLDLILRYDPITGDFEVNPYFRYLGKHSYGVKFTDEFCVAFGAPRLSTGAISKFHKDLAYNLQWRLEQIACTLVANAINTTGLHKVCIAGGVGMNCKMNGKIAQLTGVSQTYVQPASSDNGTALGAAYLASIEAAAHLPAMSDAYLGPGYSNDDIQRALDSCKLDYRVSSSVESDVADALHRGKIVGWFQGRMEVGARALGNRSILANPTLHDMREKINHEVKHRENWRPFCPALPIEYYDRYFEGCPLGEYMITAFPFTTKYAGELPAVVHVDGTARPQAVRRETNPRFHKLLLEFGKLSGHPILLNTSFNVQGEPIVMSPVHAIRCFGGTGIDLLVLNDFIVEKRLD